MLNKQQLLIDTQTALNVFRTNGIDSVLTNAIIREYQGSYHNAKTSPQKSWNAQYGRFLKENTRQLNIREIEKTVSTKDDNGNPTTCSIWELL